MKKHVHNAVMSQEVIQSLNIKPNGIYLDATFGGGGHSRLILSKLNKKGKLIAIDRDPESVKSASDILKDKRFYFINDKFSKMIYHIKKLNLLNKIDGILIDLGISSLQLDDRNRGFSYRRDGPLDMRMNNTLGYSAAQWIMQEDIKKIAWVLKKFGDERFSMPIAKAIVSVRKREKIFSTMSLVKIISDVIPFRCRDKNPAIRSFQAIRMYINDEIQEIHLMLENVLKILSINGRLSIISFNSLEDRLIKKFIRQNSQKKGVFDIPPNFPILEHMIKKKFFKSKTIKIICKMKPSLEEIKKNSRSRSSVLRCIEKVRNID